MAPREAIVLAVSRGALLALGTHKVVIGGATIEADVYQVPGSDEVHLEIDCNKQTMDTILGSVQVDGAIHMTMPMKMFEQSREILRSKMPRLAAAAVWLTSRPPMLRNGNEG